MENEKMILAKGTIVKVKGCSVELLEDTEVKGLLTTDNDTSSEHILPQKIHLNLLQNQVFITHSSLEYRINRKYESKN